MLSLVFVSISLFLFDYKIPSSSCSGPFLCLLYLHACLPFWLWTTLVSLPVFALFPGQLHVRVHSFMCIYSCVSPSVFSTSVLPVCLHCSSFLVQSLLGFCVYLFHIDYRSVSRVLVLYSESTECVSLVLFFHPFVLHLQ